MQQFTYVCFLKIYLSVQNIVVKKSRTFENGDIDKNSTDIPSILHSILMDLSLLLYRLMNFVNSSHELLQMKDISSMNLSITSGLHLALLRISSSILAINMLAKLGAYFFAHNGVRCLEKLLIFKQEIVVQ